VNVTDSRSRYSPADSTVAYHSTLECPTRLVDNSS